MNEVTTFKIRIDSVSNVNSIHFELFSGDRVHDTYVNVLTKGGYGMRGRIALSSRQFTDFANRLVAYVYSGLNRSLDDFELKALYKLNINIFDHEAPALSKSIFDNERNRLVRLGLIKGKEK